MFADLDFLNYFYFLTLFLFWKSLNVRKGGISKININRREMPFSVLRCLELVCSTKERLHFISIRLKYLSDINVIVNLKFI